MRRRIVLMLVAVALVIIPAFPASPAAPEWSEQARIQGDDLRFGDAIALSGNRVLIGAPAGFGTDAPGVAYVYQFDGTGWVERAKLEVPGADASFGETVAISGDVAVIGAGRDDTAGEDAGIAYVFAFEGNAWGSPTRLEPADPSDGAFFGADVDVDGATIAIGSPGTRPALWDPPGSFGSEGSVYIYGHLRGTWRQLSQLSASNGTDGNRFGNSVAVFGDRLAINSSEETAYLFERKRALWRQVEQIPVPDHPEASNFSSVDLSADTFIGSIQAIGTSAVFVFGQGRTGWDMEAYFEAPHSEVVFGDAAIDNGTVVLGAYIDAFTNGSGFAHVLGKRGGVWIEVDTLTATDGNRTDFGLPVDISGDFIAVGDVYENAVYIFDR